MFNMLQEATQTIAISSIAKHGIIACFGAVAHAINAHRMGKTKSFLDFILLTIMSSFSGVIFALVALYLFNNEYLTLAAAGSGGFLGVEGLAVLANKIRGAMVNSIK